MGVDRIRVAVRRLSRVDVPPSLLDIDDRLTQRQGSRTVGLRVALARGTARLEHHRALDETARTDEALIAQTREAADLKVDGEPLSIARSAAAFGQNEVRRQDPAQDRVVRATDDRLHHRRRRDVVALEGRRARHIGQTGGPEVFADDQLRQVYVARRRLNGILEDDANRADIAQLTEAHAEVVVDQIRAAQSGRAARRHLGGCAIRGHRECTDHEQRDRDRAAEPFCAAVITSHHGCSRSALPASQRQPGRRAGFWRPRCRGAKSPVDRRLCVATFRWFCPCLNRTSASSRWLDVLLATSPYRDA